MTSHELRFRHRRVEKIALSVLRVVLAVVFSTLGCGFLISPCIAADLVQRGNGPEFHVLLGLFYLAVGFVSLVPHIAARMTVVLGLLVGVTADCLPAGEDVMRFGPLLLMLALFHLALCRQIRRRADVSVWYEAFDHYADRDGLSDRNDPWASSYALSTTP